MASRRQFQYCKVIIATSMVWVMLDVFLLMYFTDCTQMSDCRRKTEQSGDLQQPQKQKIGFLQKILPKGLLPQLTPNGPGEMGKAVQVPKEREQEAKEKFKINQFNLVASDMVSLNRSLPDYRMDGCKKRKLPPVEDLAKTSIIIVFHNEAWSTLLRTVHSIINRTPQPLLEEIILVDDASEKEHLGRKLDDYVSKLPRRVRIIRLKKRTGLIRARLIGAKEATGKVLTFLDAHCECTEGWLEPLLTEIHKDRTSVVCPIIDVISDDTFEYITGSDMTWGGFNWKLNFRWYPVPQRELERRGGDRSLPTRTPTMAGGLFAIDRDYFYEIGSYDEGMDIWGGENLEMSFRVWMCGGKIFIVTCSRVGHVFRKTSPYTWPGGVARIINHNTQRIVEVWMDEYKEFFYKINPGVKNTVYGDVTERKEFRKRLKCKSFRWYLENIYPESQLPVDYFSLGEIRNKETNLCIDTMGRKSGEKVGMVGCHGMGGNQVFAFTKKKLIMTDDNLCVEAHSGAVWFTNCDNSLGRLEWDFDFQSLVLKHVNTGLCLGKPLPTDKEIPSLGPCKGDAGQQWILSDMKWNN